MRIRHLMVGVTVVAGGLLLSACDWAGFDGEKATDSESLSQSVSEVRFTNDSGDVKITVGDKLEVRRKLDYHDAKPGKSYRVDGDTLLLQACPERNCSVSYDVTVPEGTKVSGHLDSGDVEITGVASANVEAESGNVTVALDKPNGVTAATSSGNVDVTVPKGSYQVDIQADDVTNDVTNDLGDSSTGPSIALRVESGNVTLRAA